jgi:hypothetical protein
MDVTKGLFIEPRWIDLILEGRKTWEMRSMNTSHRGWFGLVGSGTGKVWGIANLIGVGRPQSVSEMLETINKHQIPEGMIRSGEVAKWNVPWILGDVKRLPRPTPTRAKGQLWINLEPAVSEAIAKQLADPMKVHGTSLIDQPASGLPSQASKEVGLPVVASVDPWASLIMGETELTEGNIKPKNSHFYLRGFLHRFPSDLIGGRDTSPPRLAKIEADRMPSTKTDICARHHFFRDRSWTRTFLANFDAAPGDVVRVVELAPYHYRVSLLKRGRA